MAIVFVLIGLLAGVAVTTLLYEHELRRMARFLRNREQTSNQRMTVHAPGRGLTQLARAVNGELDSRQAERVQSAKRQDEFQRNLASLSHDIRTPLTGAKGFMQLAQDEMSPSCDATRYLASATARLDDMNVLLNQLFAYTRATDPDATLALHRTSVMPLLADALVDHYPAFEKRGWEPLLDFQDEALAAQADDEALARIFDNLVENALRYGTTPLSITQRDREITFSNLVEDGAAIDPARLFERFYRADAARKTRGTGLGLAVAAELAEAMEMKLEASVEGDVFAITLCLPKENELPRP